MAASLTAWAQRAGMFLERYVPASDDRDAEARRRAGLFVGFSLLGVVFGALFAGFYLIIGHVWGAAIVGACTAAMAGAPWIVRRAGLEAAGNVYAGVLVLGFAGLTAIEGGMHGHAIAWLAVVPLCASILVGQQACRFWCGVCLLIMGTFCVLELLGVEMPRFYAKRWEATVTVAGYLSLALFMSMLGVQFETGRRRSLEKLHAALGALSAANERLSQLDRERSEFMGIAAHDLRSPLNSISGFAQFAQTLDAGDVVMQRDSLKHILGASKKMRELLDRLLSVQAIEEGKLELKIERCDLGPLVWAAVQNHLNAAQAKNIAIAYGPPSRPMWAEADANAVGQVLDNLISNAVKFSPPGRPVLISVEEDEEKPGRVLVEVRDTGPGLSEADQAKLYGKFARLSARPTGGETSNGLGLSIVKRLAESMGGEIRCRSKAGEGAAFSLVLPQPGAAAAKNGAPSSKAPLAAAS